MFALITICDVADIMFTSIVLKKKNKKLLINSKIEKINAPLQWYQGVNSFILDIGYCSHFSNYFSLHLIKLLNFSMLIGTIKFKPT